MRRRVRRAWLPLLVVVAPMAIVGVHRVSAAPAESTEGATSSTASTTSSAPVGIAAALAAPAPSASASGALGDPGSSMRAYEAALAAAKLAGPAYASGQGTPYSPDEIQQIVADEQEAYIAGRLAEIVSVLTGVVESPRFKLMEREPEGRAAWLLLGKALSESGVHALARIYLRKAASGPPNEGTSRAAARALTDIALEDEAYEDGIVDLQSIVEKAPTSAELRGELDYLVGRYAEQQDDPDTAMKVYAKIAPLSRFWSSATYRRGLLEVDRGDTKDAEALFCQVADPKRQDQSAPVFADERFFAVRDLARLALGRLAHEQNRHDDARYYYYLVPQDSQRLAEALYESATTRYEADDFGGARDLLDELNALGEGNAYDDESRVLDIYVDVAMCDFASANKKLDRFLATYTPLRNRVHALATGPDQAVRAFVDRGAAIEAAPEKKSTSIDDDARIWRRVEADPALLFVLRARRRLAAELGGLRASAAQLDGVATTLGGGTTKAAVDLNSLGPTREEKAAELRAAIAALRTELAALEKNGADPAKILPLNKELEALSDRAAALDAEEGEGASDDGKGAGAGLPGLVKGDEKLATSLLARGQKILAELDAAALALARDALLRLDKRSGRLLARARLAKIDVVLGEKKGLETEVEALRAGILPKDAIDSMNAVRYLRDDEEYWPFEGDEWLDEVVGGEIGAGER